MNLKMPANHSQDIVINNWDILDGDGHSLSPANMVTNTSLGYQFKFNWSLNVSGGKVLHENDTVIIPIPKSSTPKIVWTAQNGSYENFFQGTTLMGKWRFQNGNIEIVFGSNAEGAAQITGVDFTSGINALSAFYSSAVDIQDALVFQGTQKMIGYKGTPLIVGGIEPITKGGGPASNSEINWFTITGYDSVQNGSLTSGLAVAPLGQGATVQNNAYLEDVIPPDGKFSGSVAFYAALAIPASLSANSLASINASYAIDVTSHFTRRTDENKFSTYAAFKASLKPFEYGVYNNPDNTQTVVVYYGNLGNNNLTYADVEANWLQNAVNKAIDGYYPDTPANRSLLTTWFNTVYGTGNVFHGNIPAFNFHFNIKYDKVVSDTTKSNTVTYTHNGLTHKATGKGTMQGIIGNVLVNSFAARAYKMDMDSMALLPGATIKLQQYNGTSWVDYGAAKQTNTNGFVEFSSLSVAKYRFVETVAPAGYDLTKSPNYDSSIKGVVSKEFEVLASETEGHKLLLENKKIVYTPTAPKKEVFKGATEINGKEVNAGDELTYKITYKNTTGSAKNVTITDKLPEHTSFVSADNSGAEAAGVITWTKANLAHGDSFTVSFKVKVKADVNGELIKNKAKVNDGSKDYDTNEVENPTPKMPKKKTINTGDSNHMTIYLLSLVISLGVLVNVIAIRKKKQ
ncbi:MAG: SpaA isopeptide-forming pilin-related protein [Eubacterium sp.]|nr:SpaA isopeptide-forming pilin-related protein [Eubacterium sp.]